MASQALHRREGAVERVGLMARARLPRVKVIRSKHPSIGENERKGSVLRQSLQQRSTMASPFSNLKHNHRSDSEVTAIIDGTAEEGMSVNDINNVDRNL